MVDQYLKLGYQNRKDYLKQVAEDYSIPSVKVLAVANTLGSEEDFDGLITYIEDLYDLDDERFAL